MYVVPRAGTKIIIQLLLLKSCKFCRELSENRGLNSALVIGLVLPVVPDGLHIVVILETIEQLAHLGHENLSILKVINNME